MTGIIIGVAVAVLVAVGIFILLRGRKKTIEDERIREAPIRLKEVEKLGGCSEGVKQKLLEEYRKLYEETRTVFEEIQTLLKEKKLPPDLEKEYHNFLRIYNIVQEMEHEIDLYPAPNCEEYFGEKINFYRRLIREFHLKVSKLLNS